MDAALRQPLSEFDTQPVGQVISRVTNDTEVIRDLYVTVVATVLRSAALVGAIEAEGSTAVAGPRLQILGAQDHLNSLGLNLAQDGWAWDEGIGVRLRDYGPLPGRRHVPAVTGSALLVTADALAEARGWSELYGYYYEDVDLCLKLWSRGFGVVNEPGALVLHRVSATMTLTSERKFLLLERNRLLLALVHWPRWMRPDAHGGSLPAWARATHLECRPTPTQGAGCGCGPASGGAEAAAAGE